MAKRKPKTKAGKEVVRLNAVQHGILSTTPVIPGLEREEDWEAHRTGLLASLNPDGHLESELAERVAALTWRLKRVTRYESETIASSQERTGEDLEERARVAARLGERPPASIEQADMEVELAEACLQAWTSVPGPNSDTELRSADAESMLWDVERAGGDDLENIEPPDYLEDWDSIGSIAWTGRRLHEVIAAIAAQVGQEPKELVARARFVAEQDLEKAKRARDRVSSQLKNMRRERLLPDERTLNKIVKYEAHLNRQFYQALHELEALQTRRMGGQAPLARVDVQVTKEE